MKLYLFAAVCAVLAGTTLVSLRSDGDQGNTDKTPRGLLEKRVLQTSQIPVIDLTQDVGDIKKYKDEDDEIQKNNPFGGVPLRVAARVNANIKKDKDGVTEILEDGTELWRVRVKSDDALFLSFDFANIKLEDGEEIYFYSVDQNGEPDGGVDRIAGPFSKKNNNDDKLLGSPAIQGDDVVIEYTRKTGSKGNSGNPFVINRVMRGYRPFFDDDQGTRNLRDGRELQSHCSPDIACSEGDGWRDDARSVAKIYFKGYICTGQMIATIDSNDCTPYFLTARHCIDKGKTASRTTFYWNFQKPGCNSGSGSESQRSYGSSLIASYGSSDFSLLQLNKEPDPAYNVYYAGWDRRTGAASSAVCIHHPSGLPKKISFENDNLVNGNSDRWRVNNWEIGTTLGGSSGSGLWNQDHRLVGQLYGGTADCDNGEWDDFGKLDVSWQNGLSSYLDPSGTALFADGHGTCGPSEPDCSVAADCSDIDCKVATCNTGTCEYSDEPDGNSCVSGICCGGTCTSPACTGDQDCPQAAGCDVETCLNPSTCAARCEYSECGCLSKRSRCNSPSECCSGTCRSGRCK